MTHRIIFAGTPEFAVPSLQTLIAHPDFEVIAVFTQPDRPAGRGQKLSASPIKQLAEQHQLPVYQPLTLRDAGIQETIKNLAPDIMIVVAYGLLLPQAVLDMPRFGCINVHGSLLPKWRGAAPIQRSLEAGDTETGVSIMQMEKGLDTGPVFLMQSCPILPSDTSASLFEKISHLGAKALIEALPKIVTHQLQAQIQNNNEATYAHKLSKEESYLNWADTADVLERRIRAFNPWPGCCIERHGIVIKVGKSYIITTPDIAPGKILAIADQGIIIGCQENALCITEMQVPGSKMQAVSQLLQSPKFVALFAKNDKASNIEM
jgi:methionyl-tRNA formyltransferase